MGEHFIIHRSRNTYKAPRNHTLSIVSSEILLTVYVSDHIDIFVNIHNDTIQTVVNSFTVVINSDSNYGCKYPRMLNLKTNPTTIYLLASTLGTLTLEGLK